jgi:hypothetical protein
MFVSAEATEVLLNARDQATANWTQTLLKKFNATLKKRVPGLNAMIIEIPPAKVANVVRPGDFSCGDWWRLSTTFSTDANG